MISKLVFRGKIKGCGRSGSRVFLQLIKKQDNYSKIRGLGIGMLFVEVVLRFFIN